MSERKFSICLELVKRREKTLMSLTQEDLQVEDTDKLLQTFKKECVDLNSWFYIILFYYSKEDYANFKKFSNELVKTDVEQNPFYKDQKQLFIYILNILSFFYSFIAQKSKDKDNYYTYSTLSTSLVNQAEKITTFDPMTMICKGFLFFTQGDYDNSDMYFSNISDNTNSLPKNIVILAKLGRALNAYNQTNYSKGIEFFVSLIKDYNYINENILESLGICYYNLSKIEKAKEIFEKILQTYPNNTKVKVYLAIIEISDIDNENFDASFEHLIESYQNDVLNIPVLLINLCNLLLLSGQITKAGEICNKLNSQLEYGEMKYVPNNNNRKDKFKQDFSDIKTAIYVMNAKYQLSLKNIKEALSFFLKSTQCNPKNIEAQFGLGQIYLSMQNLSEAEKCFEICKTILDDGKKVSFKVLKYLGYIQSKTKRKEIEKIIELYKLAIQTKPDDIDCYIELAELLNLKNPEESLKYYQSAIDLIQNPNQDMDKDQDCSTLYTKDILPEVLNNIGCILIRLERYSEAEPYLTQAKNLVRKEINIKQNNKKETIRLQAIKLGIEFNFVIYHEKRAQFDYAHLICKKIIDQNPYFIEAYIKLSEFAKLRGHKSKANEYIKLAIEKNFINEENSKSDPEAKANENKQSVKKLISIMNKPINPMIIQAYLIYESGKPEEAINKLIQILKFYDDKDPYTLVFLGNIYYSMAIENRSKGVKKLTQAVEFYFRALECDKYNVLAAIGLCNCLAEFNYVDKALEVYKGITEVMENDHNAFVNESLLYMNEKKWEKASIILNKVLKKIFNGKNQTIENLLCKCCIETKDFVKANHLIKNLMMKYPENIVYKFDYGILLIAKSNEILSKTERKVLETKEAIGLIEKSIKLFETIILLRKDFYYKCNEMISLWKLNLNTANNSLLEDKHREEEMNKKIEMNIMEYNKILEAQNEKKKENELNMEENEKLYEQNREMAQRIANMIIVDPSKPVKKKRQKIAEDAFVEKEEKIEENNSGNDDHKHKHKHKHKHRHKHKHKRHKRDRSENEINSQSDNDNEEEKNEEAKSDSERKKKKKKKKKKLHRKRDYEDEEEDPFALPEDNRNNDEDKMNVEVQEQEDQNEESQDKELEIDPEVDNEQEKVEQAQAQAQGQPQENE